MQQGKQDNNKKKNIKNFSDSELLEVITRINDNYKKIEDNKPVVVLIGKTQSGKSTLTNKLLNQKMKVEKNIKGLYILKEDSSNETKVRVGDGKKPCSKIPIFYKSDDLPFSILDTRGYKDPSHELFDIIASSFLVDLYLKNVRRIVPVIMINIENIIEPMKFFETKDIVVDLVKNKNLPFMFVSNYWKPGPLQVDLYKTTDEKEYMRELDNILGAGLVDSMKTAWTPIVQFLIGDDFLLRKTKTSLIEKFEASTSKMLSHHNDENEDERRREDEEFEEEMKTVMDKFYEKHKKNMDNVVLEELEKATSEMNYIFILKKAFEDKRLIYYDGLRELTVDRLKEKLSKAKTMHPSQVNIGDAVEESKNLKTLIMTRITRFKTIIRIITLSYSFPTHIEEIIERCGYYITQLKEGNEEILKGKNNVIEQLSKDEINRRIESCERNINNIKRALTRVEQVKKEADISAYRCYDGINFESDDYKKSNTCSVDEDICEDTKVNFLLSRSTKLVKEEKNIQTLKYHAEFSAPKDDSYILKLLKDTGRVIINNFRYEDDIRRDVVCHGIVFFSAPYNKTPRGKEVLERLNQKEDYLRRTLSRLENNIIKYKEQKDNKTTVDLRRGNIAELEKYRKKLIETVLVIERATELYDENIALLNELYRFVNVVYLSQKNNSSSSSSSSLSSSSSSSDEESESETSTDDEEEEEEETLAQNFYPQLKQNSYEDDNYNKVLCKEFKRSMDDMNNVVSKREREKNKRINKERIQMSDIKIFVNSISDNYLDDINSRL